ncbi:hypothetical protein CPT_Mater177 [Bacillus phage Mater]|uniref:Uncharacterized protein n=1 Tax=Bacillus phage Mater TaxID=1540090 RepID=A0A0A0RNW9_9CAUD|nr:virion structural protein [Bacillus phage Mater]AIW03334.1 hypothetical protein CPT_Mater177 [Bacillus phage Mater]
MAEKPSILNTISTAGVRTDMMDVTTNSMGIPCLWEKSYLCPCRDRATKQPNQACPRCHGRGIAYLPPVPIRIIIQSQEKGAFNADLGLMDSGTAIGTPADRTARLAFRDRITVPDAKVSQSFIFDVSDRRVKNGFYMVYDVNEIEYAVTVDQELQAGIDYEFNKQKNLFIPKPHLLNKMISINILTTLRYMIADLLKEHRYAPNQAQQLVQMPQKLLLKREDIFIDKEAFEVGVNNEQVAEMIDTKRKPSTDGLNGFFRNG